VFGDGECSTHPSLSDLPLLNQGTVLLGAEGGAPDGVLLMSDGTVIHNTGTFHDDSYEGSCGFAPAGYSLYDARGAASFVNEGAFVADIAGTSTDVGVPIGNDGSVEARAGRLELSDGGLEEQVATGSWSAPGGEAALTGGEFLFAKEVDLPAVKEAGAVVEQELWSHAPPAIEGEAVEGKTLTASPHWTGPYAPSLRSPDSLTGQPATFTYQWEECDGEDEGEEGEEHEVPGTECEELLGATSSTYKLEEEELGYTMRVVVTAHNTLGTETYISEATPVIEEPAVEVPEGEEEGSEPLFTPFRFGPTITLKYPLRSSTKLYEAARELYQYFANVGYEKRYHETGGHNYLYAQQIAAMIGVFYVETPRNLEPGTGKYPACEEEGCPTGIAQWLREGPDRRWQHLKEYIEEQCTRHDNCEARHHGEYSIYTQARVVWEELLGPREGQPKWAERLYHEALEDLETEGHCERPERKEHCKGVSIKGAAEKFIGDFEKSTSDRFISEIDQFAEEVRLEAKEEKVRHEGKTNKKW
jgi:hypothetical protein